MQCAVGHHLGYERIEAGLRHRTTADADLIDLCSVNVYSPDVMAAGGEAGCRHGPDIAKTDHRNLHRPTSHRDSAPADPT
jgi:hypothetical protein